MPLQSTDMMFEVLDTNKSGNIEFSEFKAAMLRTCLHLHSQSIRRAFQFFDRDNSGTISQKEMRAVFHSYDDLFDIFNTNDFDKIIMQADLNHDGKISYEEFVKFLTMELEKENFVV